MQSMCDSNIEVDSSALPPKKINICIKTTKYVVNINSIKIATVFTSHHMIIIFQEVH